MQVRDVAQDPVDHLGCRTPGGLRLRESQRVPVQAREEEQGVVLREREVLVDVGEGRHLRERVGEQGAEPCRHLVTYVHQVREVGRDLRIVHPKRGDRTGRHVARIL